MSNRLKSSLHQISPLLVGLGALILYGATSAPSIGALYDDSLEFQLVGPTFGIAHPTGYPLYILLSGLWSRLLFPFGNWAWRMNLFSAVAGAVTVALIFAISRRLAEGNLWAGLAAALAFALSPIWWRQTTIAEVYALHGLFVAAILYTVLNISDSCHAPVEQIDKTQPALAPGQNRILVLFILIGLSLTHHRTSLLILPGVSLYLLLIDPGLWRPQRAWITWALALLAPLLLYGYLPLRASMGVADLEGDYTNTWVGFWHHVLARGYTGFFTANELAVERRLADWLLLFGNQFGWIGAALGGLGIGIGLLDRRHRPAWVLIVLILVINLLFAANYRVADAEVFALPAFLCMALGIGGAMTPITAFTSHLPPFLSRLAQPLLVLILLFIPLGRGPFVDRSDSWAIHDYAVAMANVDFPVGSEVVGLRGQMTALTYMQHAEGIGQAARPVAIDDPEERRTYVDAAIAAGKPVYLTQELAGIETRYPFSGEGPLVRVWPRNETKIGQPSISVDYALANDALRLLGYDLDVLAQAGGPALRVSFYWLPTQSLGRTLKLSLRLLDVDDAILAQEDHFPLRQVALTPQWQPGQIVRDVHYLPLPAEAKTLLVIVYDAETIEETGRILIPLPR
jgi:hypothetical protein